MQATTHAKKKRKKAKIVHDTVVCQSHRLPVDRQRDHNNSQRQSTAVEIKRKSIPTMTIATNANHENSNIQLNVSNRMCVCVNSGKLLIARRNEKEECNLQMIPIARLSQLM